MTIPHANTSSQSDDATAVRAATESDIARVTEIFNQSIATSTATLHLEPLSVEQQLKWYQQHDARHVVLVAETDDGVVGWAALGPWEDRAGYRDTAEVSVYVDNAFQGRGHGGRLLEALVGQARSKSFHTLIARIVTDHERSLNLHRRCGFEDIGTMRQAGRKFDAWVDVQILQLMLEPTSMEAQPIGFFNGQYLPLSQIRLPLNDLGVRLGVLITETLRTFGGQVHLLGQHLQRLEGGLKAIGLSEQIDLAELEAATNRVAKYNYGLAQQDLAVSMFVTPGSHDQPTRSITTSPLPLDEFAKRYQQGISLVTVEIREIPGQCIPRHVKHRNRLHYYLAEQQARQQDPQARALLLDVDGGVCEGTTAAVVAYFADEGLVAPPEEKVLGSVSWDFTAQLAEQEKIAIKRRDIRPDELTSAEEVLWCSTPMCLYAVTQIDGQAVGNGKPGHLFHGLLDAWSHAVGVRLHAS